MRMVAGAGGDDVAVDVDQPLTAASFAAHAEALVARDAHLAAALDAYGVPPFWTRPAGFASLVLLVVEQQVSLASAKAVFDRVARAVGGVTPEALLAADLDVLGRAGLTRQKQRYVTLLAVAVAEGRLDLDALGTLPEAEARARLLALTGVGPWTADCYLLACLRRPDVWPVGDRALQVGVGEVLGLDGPPDPVGLEELGARWRPVRAVAARLVWHAYLCRRGRAETVVDGLDPLDPFDPRGLP
jgi:DNA-3-methyladenine glycosylase II